ncbi:hypothetical protein AJE_12074 [Alishewanella jeotgali KCTC 22429]|uniref:DUF3083 domain-containing protein n=2 Tax=Alishewanella jeotgali TaxID=545533 RepID=H3ZGB8_9ALTE|nr:hypothetical protein AJE_12074 [Alishewanella jeotgali KCTC 22429]
MLTSWHICQPFCYNWRNFNLYRSTVMPVSSQHKVYLPASARDNQYLLAEFVLSDELVARYPASSTDTPYLALYQALSQKLFELADQFGLRNVHLIANGKTPVVRFHQEAYVLQTAEQILFFYNPSYHEAQHSFYDAKVRARKISLLFLATEQPLRSNAAAFHQQVTTLLTELRNRLALAELKIKVRDHQHLTYDLFAKAKGSKESYGYKLRSIDARYKARQAELPAHSALTYVIVNLPLSRRLKEQVKLDLHSSSPYLPLYQHIADHFVSACQQEKLQHLAVLANGLLPLVRNSQFDKSSQGTELQMIGFDPSAKQGQLVSDLQGDKLVEMMQLIIFATPDDQTDMGYGRFMNEVESALRRFAKAVNLQPERDDLTVRFHQHISYHQ